MKRLLAIFFAVIMVVAIVGCGAKKRQPIMLTLSTEDAEAILKAAGIVLPSAEDCGVEAGTIVKLYGYRNDLQNYSEDEMVQTGYWTFHEKYQCDIEWIESTYEETFTRLAALILSGDNPDFYPAWVTDFPMYSLNGVFVAVDDYIDYNDPLWSEMKYFADTYFTLGGHHYMFLTDTEFNSIVIYNRRVFDEWGFDDPAELFYNNEWTWNEMLDMALDFTDPDEGRYAFNSWGTDAALMSSTGTDVVIFDTATGEFVSNIDDPRLERAATMLLEFQKNDCEYPMWSNGWSLNYDADGGGMKEGKTLFAMAGNYIIEERRSIEEMEAIFGDVTNEEIMIVPVPRDPNGDGEYYIDTKVKGYCLIMGARNPEAVGLLAACDRFKIIDPTVINFDKKQLKEKLGYTDEMLDMWDTMYEISHSHNAFAQYGGGLGSASDYTDRMINFNRAGGEDSWAQRKESYKDTIQYYLDELNTQIDSLGQ